MANIGGPAQSRCILMMAIYSILIYGSELCEDALKVDCGIRILSLVQQTSALRVASAYRFVSKSAILVISGVMPTGLQASE